jgi:zinc D-Ala-D-Ala dipeptidase
MIKIMKIFITLTIILLPVFLLGNDTIPFNKYGLKVITLKSDYLLKAGEDKDHKMIELRSIIPGIIYDLRYADTANFMHRSMYPRRTDKTFLRYPAAIALSKVSEELEEKGYALKIWDAYRPYSVTESFWDLVKDERYAANPAKGSGHNRGLAVDLTLVHIESDFELDMGTDFDDFSERAHSNYNHLPKEVLKNRKILKDAMTKAGFMQLETEWWHFYWPNNKQYDLLDIPFSKL